MKNANALRVAAEVWRWTAWITMVGAWAFVGRLVPPGEPDVGLPLAIAFWAFSISFGFGLMYFYDVFTAGIRPVTPNLRLYVTCYALCAVIFVGAAIFFPPE